MQGQLLLPIHPAFNEEWAVSQLSLVLEDTGSSFSADKARVLRAQPVYARQAFPCFDEPWMKATFQTTLALPPAEMALSNMPLVGNASLDPTSGLRVWAFDTTPVMSSYLNAWVVGRTIHILA